MIVRRGVSVPGILLVRCSQRDVWAVRDRLLAVVGRHSERLYRMYAAVTPTRARLRRLPEPHARRRIGFFGWRTSPVMRRIATPGVDGAPWMAHLRGQAPRPLAQLVLPHRPRSP
jgi:hypothetical protein